MKKLIVFSIIGALALAGGTTTAQSDLGVASTTGLVVSSSDIASDTGAAILAKGGNAVDAAVATAFALAVTHPFAGNIGGGGFMVVRAADGTATTFDYRETAPGKSTPTMYLGKDGNIDMSLTRAGYLAPGVPGTVRGLALAHKKFGKLPWKDVVMPAVDLAGKGFALPASLARGLNGEVSGAMSRFPASVAAYGKPGGGQWAAGDRIMLADLAKTLTSIATDGPDAFYTGWIADRIAEDMAANQGLITKADLAAYQAKERAPIRGTFLGYDIISMPPPSSGGTTLVAMLNMLEALDIQKQPHGSVAGIHLTIEAMRRAYLDRARYLGDPDFVDVPVAKLISKPYAEDLAKTIDPVKATSSVEIGKDLLGKTFADEPSDTTHFSVVDKDGMAVSNTFTLEGGYGSHVVVKGAGFILNNEMGDFNKKPGTTDLTGNIGTPANVIAPGKRMLSSMTPTIVTKGGKLVLVTGSPGSRTIINTVLNIVLNVTAYGMNGRDAIDAKRFDHEWLPDRITFEANGLPADAMDKLKAMGHDIRANGSQGSAQSIWIDPKTGTAYGEAWTIATPRRRRQSQAESRSRVQQVRQVRRGGPFDSLRSLRPGNVSHARPVYASRPSSGVRHMRIPVFGVAVTVLALTAAAPLIVAAQQKETENVNKTVPFPNGGTLRVKNFSGGITITGTSGHDVVVKAVRTATRDRLDHVKFTVDTSGSSVTINANDRDESWKDHNDNVVETTMEIQVPTSARLDEVDAFSSGLDISGVSGVEHLKTFFLGRIPRFVMPRTHSTPNRSAAPLRSMPPRPATTRISSSTRSAVTSTRGSPTTHAERCTSIRSAADSTPTFPSASTRCASATSPPSCRAVQDTISTSTRSAET